MSEWSKDRKRGLKAARGGMGRRGLTRVISPSAGDAAV